MRTKNTYIVKIVEKKSAVVKLKEYLEKWYRCIFTIERLLLKTPTAPRYWLRLTGIDDRN